MSQKNKDVVRRFNLEVIQEGRAESARELMSDSFINRTAQPGGDAGPQGMLNTFNGILRPALSDLKVLIHEQVAEGDLVTTRKSISGVHTGTLLGVPATGRRVHIDAMDIVRILNGQYVEHWGMNNLAQIVAGLKLP